jgi:uncharacterized Zn finger protein
MIDGPVQLMSRKHRRMYRNSPIAENTIHTWVGESQFNRGLKYVDQRQLHHHHRRGNSVRAICIGTKHGPSKYQVRATVVEGKIEEAWCSCSIGKYGVCPHIAAMLIEYSRTPEAFVKVSWLEKVKRLLGMEK